MANKFNFAANFWDEQKKKQEQKSREALEQAGFAAKPLPTAQQVINQGKGPVNTPTKSQKKTTSKKTSQTTVNKKTAAPPKAVQIPSFQTLYGTYRDTTTPQTMQRIRKREEERKQQHFGRGKDKEYTFGKAPNARSISSRKREEQRQERFKKKQAEMADKFAARKKRLFETSRNNSLSDAFINSLPKNTRNALKPLREQKLLRVNERPTYGINPIGDHINAAEETAEDMINAKMARQWMDKYISEQKKNLGKSTIRQATQNFNNTFFENEPNKLIKEKKSEQQALLKKGKNAADALSLNPRLIDTKSTYDAFGILFGAEKEKQKPILSSESGIIKGDNLRILKSVEHGLEPGTGNDIRIADFMSDSQMYAYYYLYGSQGEQAAIKYLDNIKPEIIRTAEEYQQNIEYQKYGKEAPMASFLTTFNASIGSALEGAQNLTKRENLTNADFATRQAMNAIHAGRTAGKSGAKKQFYDILNMVVENAPEMIANSIPVVGPLLSGAIAFSSSANRKLEEKNQIGLANSNEALLEATVSGALDALPWGFGNEISYKLAGRVFNKLPQSALKEFMTNVVSYTASMAGTSLTQQTIEEGLDVALFRKDGTDNLSLIKQSYIEQGMSEDEAASKAVWDMAKMFLTTAVASGITGAISGAAQGAKRTAPMVQAGKTLKRKGIGLENLLEEAQSMPQNSQAYKNAENLRRYTQKGNDAHSDMLGAQALLNKEARKAQDITIGKLKRLSGVDISEGETDDIANAVYKDGKITVAKNPDEDRVTVIKHDLTHAAQDRNAEIYKAYSDILEQSGGFEKAVERKKRDYEAIGKPIDDDRAAREVAADFAMSLKIPDSEIERAIRASRGASTFSDKLYDAVNDLYARMKAKRATMYADERTGISLTYQEINNARRALLNAVSGGGKQGVRAVETEGLFSTVKNLDSKAYGVNIDKEVTDIADSVGMNKKLWTAAKKAEVKDTLRNAYAAYKKGDDVQGDTFLEKAAIKISMSAKHYEKVDETALVKKFKDLYKSGKTYLETASNDKKNVNDMRAYHIKASKVAANIAEQEGVDRVGYSQIHKQNTEDIRKAFDILKSGTAKAEQRAKEQLRPFVNRVLDEARIKNPAYDDNNKSVISLIRKTQVNLEPYRNSKDANKRNVYDTLKYVMSNKAESAILDDIINEDDMAQKIAETYTTLKDGEYMPRYQNSQSRAEAESAILDDIINDYKMAQPAAKETDSATAARDREKYGEDIEKRFRDNIDIDDFSEGEVQGLASLVRDTLDKMTESIKNPTDDADLTPYENLAENVDSVIARITDGKNRTSDEKISMVSELFGSICDNADALIAKRKTELLDILNHASMNGDETKVKSIRAEIDSTDKTQENFQNYVLSKVYTNSAQKGWTLDEMKKSLSENEERFSYEIKTNDSAYKAASDRLASNDINDVYTELMTKTDAWTKDDIVTAQLIITRLQGRGETAKAVDLFERAQKASTQSGQVVQAWSFVNYLTPEGRLMAVERSAIKNVQEQLEKRDPSGELVKRWERAQRMDAEVRKQAEEQLKTTSKEYAELMTKTNETEQRLLKARAELRNAENMRDGAEESIRHMETVLQEQSDKKQKLTDEYNSLLKKYEKQQKLLDEKLAELKNIKRDINTTQRRSDKLNTKINQAADNVNQKRGELDKLTEEYEAKTREYDILKSEHTKLKRDINTTQRRIENLKTQIPQTAENIRQKRKELDEYKELYYRAHAEYVGENKELKDVTKETKKLIRAYENLIRSGDKDVDSMTYLEQFYKKHGVMYVSDEMLDHYSALITDIDDITDNNKAIDFILNTSKERKMPHGAATKAIMKAEFKNVDIELLKNIAYQQVFSMIDETVPRRMGRIASTLLAMNQLLNPKTIIRNIVGNFVFNEFETLTHSAAAIVDILMYPLKRRRDVTFEMPVGWINGFKRAGLSYLETALGVDIIDSSAKYGYTPAKNRTFKGGRLNPLAMSERSLSYGLTVPDEYDKGVIEQRLRRGIKRLENSGWKDWEIEEMIRQELSYRTFQDDTMIARTLDGVKKALNNIGTDDFGAGNLITNYTVVPGNIVTRSLEYSPLGTLKAVYDLGKFTKMSIKNRQKFTPLQQRKLLLEFMRPLTGAGLIWAGWQLRKAGIIIQKPEEADDEWRKKKFYQTTGEGEFQLNLSALKRYLNVNTDAENEDETQQEYLTLAKEGDTLLSLTSIVGINSSLQIGAYLAEKVTGESSIGELAAQTAAGTGKASLNQLTSLSMWTSINNIVNNWKYTDSFYQFAAAEGADLIMSFYPSVLRQLGNALDSSVRYPYKGKDYAETIKFKIYSKLPKMSLRNQVPVSVDSFGERRDKSLGSFKLDMLNNFVFPDTVTKYNENPLTNELERLSVYSSDVLPQTPYNTNNVKIDDQNYTFTLSGKNHEEFSAILGQTIYSAMMNFANSEDYKLLNDSQRVEEFEKINKEVNKLVQQAWVKKQLGQTVEQIQSEISEGIADYANDAGRYVKKRQLQNALESDTVNTDEIVEAYTMREYNDKEKAEAIKDNNAKIAKVKAGTYYRKEKGTDGKEHRVYSRNWTAQERQKKIEEFENANEKIQNGTTQKRDYITDKKWSELTDEQREQILKNIDKYIDDLTVPEAFAKEKPDMSGEGYAEQEDTTIDVTNPLDAQTGSQLLSDMYFKAPAPDTAQIDGGQSSAAYYSGKTRRKSSFRRSYRKYRKKWKSGRAKLYRGTKRYRAKLYVGANKAVFRGGYNRYFSSSTGRRSRTSRRSDRIFTARTNAFSGRRFQRRSQRRVFNSA
jgi:hypothetical protein